MQRFVGLQKLQVDLMGFFENIHFRVQRGRRGSSIVVVVVAAAAAAVAAVAAVVAAAAARVGVCSLLNPLVVLLACFVKQ